MAAPTNEFRSFTLYVGDLAKTVAEHELFEIFNAVGPVASVRVCRDSQTRASLGYAYVNFVRAEDAQRALDTMNFQKIHDQPCRIMWSHRDPTLRRSGKGNLFIKNLPKDIDTQQMHDIFSRFGDILSCKVAMNNNRESLGYGFVHFTKEEHALRAMELLNGKSLQQAGDDKSSEAEADQSGSPPLMVVPFKSKSERGGGKQLFTNVYVKNIPKDWTNEQLNAAFAHCGEITSSKVSAVEGSEGQNKGFGFVNFETHEQAQKAVDEMHDKVVVEGQPALYVCRAQSRAERAQELEQQRREHAKKYVGNNLYIKNLPEEITEEELVKLFENFGDITSTKVMRDEAGKSKGFGFVCFSNQEEATRAISEMSGHRVLNKPLYVGLAQPKSVRQAQLQAQNSARQQQKAGMPGMMPFGPQMYYPQPGRAYMYPAMVQPHPGRNFGPGQPTQGGRVRPPQMPGQGQFQLMAVQNGQQVRGGPRGGPNRGGRGPRTQGGHPMSRRPAPQQIPPQTQPEIVQPPQVSMEDLAKMSEPEQKNYLGEQLYLKINQHHPELAGKITGMLLEVDPAELVNLLEDDAALMERMKEAIDVLEQANKEAVEVSQ